MPLVISICFALFLWCGCTEPGEEAPSDLPESGPPDGLNLHNRLGEKHLAAHRLSRALAAFQKALVGTEDSVWTYTGLSRTYLAMGQRALAEEALRQATFLDTTRAEISFARAELDLEQYFRTPQGLLLDRALAATRQAARLDPGRKAYFYTLGNLYNHRGDLDSAEVAYRQSLSLDSDLAPAYERLGRLYKYQGRFVEAEKAYRKLLELRPEDARTMCELAVFYRADGRLAGALELLEKAALLDTNLAMAYLNLGQLYLAAGRTEAGEKALERFRALNEDEEDTALLLAQAEAHPRDANARLRLAAAYVKEGEFARAERRYLEVIRLDSRLAAAYAGLGRLYLLRESYELAAQTLEKAAELDSRQVGIYDLLATAYRQSGDHQKERQARQKAKELSVEGR